MKKYLLITLMLTILFSCSQVITDTLQVIGSKGILTYSFPAELNAALAEDVVGIVNGTTRIISATVPWGTIVSTLVAEFTYQGVGISIGDTQQVSGTTENDYSSGVTYRVLAGDDTSLNYLVAVDEALPPGPRILDFSVSADSVNWYSATVDHTDYSVDVVVPAGTSLISLTIQFTLYGDRLLQSAVEQTSGSSTHDFTGPLSFVAADLAGNSQDYTVTVANEVLAPQITAFSMTTADNIGAGLQFDVTGTVDQAAGTIDLLVPSDVDPTVLIATFSVNTSNSIAVSSVPQTSGVTDNDFSGAVSYVVTSSDSSSTKTYSVTATPYAVWQPAGLRALDAAPTNVDQVDLTVDSSTGDLYAVYVIQPAQQIEVRRYTGGSWNLLGISDFAGRAVARPQIEFYNNTVYVAFADNVIVGTDWNISVMFYPVPAGPWQYYSGAGEIHTQTTGAYDFDMDIDSTGEVYVAIQDSANAGSLGVLYYTGAAWAYLDSANINGAAIERPEIYIDENDDIFVAFGEDTGGGLSFEATAYRFQAAVWAKLGATGLNMDHTWNPVHIAAAGGTPYIAFTESGAVSVLSYNGASWIDVDSTGLGITSGTFSMDLALDGTTPYIIHEDSIDRRYSLSRYNGSAWELVGTGLFTPADCDYVALEFYTSVPYVLVPDGFTASPAGDDYDGAPSVFVFE